MIYRAHIPQPPLSAFVALFWFSEGYCPSHAKERLLPSGTMELVINLREDTLRVYDRHDTDKSQSFRGSLICGAHSEFFVIDTDGQAETIGVHFKPGGAFPFFRVPACELRDAHISLDVLWGAAAGELREQLLEAETPEAKFRILEQSLMTHAARPLAQHPAVSFALQEFRNVPHIRKVSEITEHVGLSRRRFIQLFSEEVGLTPKIFCRIQRFQAVLRLVGKVRRVEWADIASACGYFDQAHFIRDFQAFCGLNPSVYLTHRGEHPNHLPLRD